MMKSICLLLVLFATNLHALPQSFYDITAKNLEGQTVPMSAFRGRVVLIVNTSIKDSNATQMNMLEELYQKYSETGLVIVAFPSNDFSHDVLGTNQEVRAAYQEQFDVTFPVLEPVHVIGPNISPLYAFLTNSRTNPNFGWEVEWNFTKFLIDQNGTVINRFGTTTLPNDPKFVDAIVKALSSPTTT